MVVDEDKSAPTEKLDTPLALDFDGDDPPTVPMNPNFLNVSGVKDNPDTDNKTPENQLGDSYGEGRDKTLEPYK